MFCAQSPVALIFDVEEGESSTHNGASGIRHIFSYVENLLLVVLCSTATVERSFSELRRLKTWLHSTMSQNRLNHLAILNVHQTASDNVCLSRVANEFV